MLEIFLRDIHNLIEIQTLERYHVFPLGCIMFYSIHRRIISMFGVSSRKLDAIRGVRARLKERFRDHWFQEYHLPIVKTIYEGLRKWHFIELWG